MLFVVDFYFNEESSNQGFKDQDNMKVVQTLQYGDYGEIPECGGP